MVRIVLEHFKVNMMTKLWISGDQATKLGPLVLSTLFLALNIFIVICSLLVRMRPHLPPVVGIATMLIEKERKLVMLTSQAETGRNYCVGVLFAS